MASDVWYNTIQMAREETRCRHIGYSFRLTEMIILYAPSHKRDNTAFVTLVEEHCLEREIAQCIYSMKDRSDDPSHNEQTLLPRMYVCMYVCVYVYMYACVYLGIFYKLCFENVFT